MSKAPNPPPEDAIRPSPPPAPPPAPPPPDYSLRLVESDYLVDLVRNVISNMTERERAKFRTRIFEGYCQNCFVDVEQCNEQCTGKPK